MSWIFETGKLFLCIPAAAAFGMFAAYVYAKLLPAKAPTTERYAEDDNGHVVDLEDEAAVYGAHMGYFKEDW